MLDCIGQVYFSSHLKLSYSWPQKALSFEIVSKLFVLLSLKHVLDI